MKMRWTKRMWIVHSASQLNTQYEVRICSDGSFVCTCPDFQEGKTCKHIRKAKLMLAGERQKNKLPGVA